MKDVHLKYNGFNALLRKEFGEKVQRVSLNLGLTCPNIDGTVATGGCHFCSDDHLLGKSWHKQQPIKLQLEYGINYLRERHKTTKHLAYFQNGSNTYTAPDKLLSVCKEVLANKSIVGLMISTRPDCLSQDILDVLSTLNKETYLWVELGLQSTKNHVLKKINRGHTIEQFIDAVHQLAQRQIKNCVHIILGMPGETQDEMIDGVHTINKLPVDGIKIHNMFIAKDTVLAKWYQKGLYTPLELDEYANLCVNYLERLRPNISIHRLNGHAPDRLTVAPKWSVNKFGTLNAVHREIVKRDTYQGKLYKAIIQTP